MQNAPATGGRCAVLVPAAGLEPARPSGLGILSPLCLPFHHAGGESAGLRFTAQHGWGQPRADCAHSGAAQPGVRRRPGRAQSGTRAARAQAQAGVRRRPGSGAAQIWQHERRQQHRHVPGVIAVFRKSRAQHPFLILGPAYLKGKPDRGQGGLPRSPPARATPDAGLRRTAAIDLAWRVRHKESSSLHLGGLAYEKGLQLGHSGFGRSFV